jgi:hypothetical protein
VLRILGRPTTGLPGEWLTHVPLLQHATPQRFPAYAALGLGVIAAIWVARGTGWTAWIRWVVAGLAAVAILPAPDPSAFHAYGQTPAFFTNGEVQQWITQDEMVFSVTERPASELQWLAASGFWYQIAQAYIGKVGLVGFEHHYPKQLSGGMQQRTAIARALANGPRMLLMDEPFGALDHQTRELMQELLLGIWEAERKTVLFVTHDIDEAVFMGSRVVVMSARPGRIKLDRPVPIAHPRHYSVKTTAPFSALKAELTEQVRVEVKAAQNAAEAAASAS